METLNVDIDKPEDFKRIVSTGLPQAGPLGVVTASGITDKGKPGAVISFDVQLPDGSVRTAQAMTTVRLLQVLGHELVKQYGVLETTLVGKVNDLNPGAVIGDQVREHWQQLCALLVWKLARQSGVSITHKDMERYAQEAQRGEAVFTFLGQNDRINFKIVDRKRADELAAYDRTQRGNA